MKFRDLFKKKDYFKIGEKCNWNDIEVGEVFGVSGCFNIMMKLTKTSAIMLDTDTSFISYIGKVYKKRVSYLYGTDCLRYDEGVITYNGLPAYYFELDVFNSSYKLPKETQELYYVK